MYVVLLCWCVRDAYLVLTAFLMDQKQLNPHLEALSEVRFVFFSVELAVDDFPAVFVPLPGSRNCCITIILLVFSDSRKEFLDGRLLFVPHVVRDGHRSGENTCGGRIATVVTSPFSQVFYRHNRRVPGGGTSAIGGDTWHAVCDVFCLHRFNGSDAFPSQPPLSSSRHGAVQRKEQFVIGVVGVFVYIQVVRVVHAISEIRVVEILVRVSESQRVAELVTHCVLPSSESHVQKVVLVHPSRTRNHVPLVIQQGFVDPSPLGIPVIAIAYNHFSVGRLAISIIGCRLLDDLDRIGLAISPILRGEGKGVLPLVAQCVYDGYSQSVATPWPVRGIAATERIF
mmetsp:Transcript_11878/g.25100  ORF Transcript_11878/g.25100 Transcript_11878/m.25100 type:complete len:341 (+) Transcript_11878:187-1209(+)